MSNEEYLRSILTRGAVDYGPYSAARQTQLVLEPIIRRWAGDQFRSMSPSGSFAKQTANNSGTDIDLFVSLHANTSNTLKELYEGVFACLGAYSPKRQNVSVNVKVNGFDVDVVPAKQQNVGSEDHSLYRRRVDSWTKTNVQTHIAHVRAYGRIAESRVLKLWRGQKGLDFPSFYLELVVIEALSGQSLATLDQKVWRVFQYLSTDFVGARFVDPANTNNIISDDLTATEKAAIKSTAQRALGAKDWNEIVR